MCQDTTDFDGYTAQDGYSIVELVIGVVAAEAVVDEQYKVDFDRTDLREPKQLVSGMVKAYRSVRTKLDTDFDREGYRVGVPGDLWFEHWRTEVYAVTGKWVPLVSTGKDIFVAVAVAVAVV